MLHMNELACSVIQMINLHFAILKYAITLLFKEITLFQTRSKNKIYTKVMVNPNFFHLNGYGLPKQKKGYGYP